MKRLTNEKMAIILAVSVILSVTACSAEGVAYIDGNRSEPGFSSSAAATSGTIYEESTLPATVSITTAVTTTKAKKTTAVLTTVASTPATTAEPKWKETKKSAEMYLNTSVYSRTKAYLGAPTADLYMVNDKVKVVAVTTLIIISWKTADLFTAIISAAKKPLSKQRLPQHPRPKRPPLRQ